MRKWFGVALLGALAWIVALFLYAALETADGGAAMAGKVVATVLVIGGVGAFVVGIAGAGIALIRGR